MSFFILVWFYEYFHFRGRKKICLTFVVLYALACLTKHSSNLVVLMIGRFFSGIATSILSSVFESWMIYEHNNAKFDPSWIGDTFYQQTFANGIIAILSGFVSNFLYDIIGSPVAPFDCKFLIVKLLIIYNNLILLFLLINIRCHYLPRYWRCNNLL